MTHRTLCTLLALFFCGAAGAQTYPSKPLRIIVPFAQGGAADLLSRMVGQRLQEAWGQPVVVENRTGANGNIGMESAAKSAPDGYTLVQVPNAGFEAVSWYSIMVPAGTQKEVIERINGEIARLLGQPDTCEKLAGIGATAIGGTPEQLATVIIKESAIYADLFKRSGIRAE